MKTNNFLKIILILFSCISLVACGGENEVIKDDFIKISHKLPMETGDFRYYKLYEIYTDFRVVKGRWHDDAKHNSGTIHISEDKTTIEIVYSYGGKDIWENCTVYEDSIEFYGVYFYFAVTIEGDIVFVRTFTDQAGTDFAYTGGEYFYLR